MEWSSSKKLFRGHIFYISLDPSKNGVKTHFSKLTKYSNFVEKNRVILSILSKSLFLQPFSQLAMDSKIANGGRFSILLWRNDPERFLDFNLVYIMLWWK